MNIFWWLFKAAGIVWNDNPWEVKEEFLNSLPATSCREALHSLKRSIHEHVRGIHNFGSCRLLFHCRVFLPWSIGLLASSLAIDLSHIIHICNHDIVNGNFEILWHDCLPHDIRKLIVIDKASLTGSFVFSNSRFRKTSLEKGMYKRGIVRIMWASREKPTRLGR